MIPGIRIVSLERPSARFVCRQCLRQQPQSASSRILPSLRQSRRHATTTASTTTSKTRTTRRPAFSPVFFSPRLNAALSMATHATAPVAKRAFPETTSSKSVAYWLLGSAASVFGIVVFGGLTRLTESGYAHNSKRRDAMASISSALC